MRPLAIVLWLSAVGCTRSAHHAADGGGGAGGLVGDAAMAPDDGGGTNAELGVGSGGDGGVPPDPATYHARADAALGALLVRYWSPSADYLEAAAPSTGAVTGYWTFAQAFDAVLDGVERTQGAHFAGWIEALYAAQNARGFTRDFYDDENWMALALIRATDLSGDSKYLNQAKTLYADIEAAWDTSCCGAHPGGIWWDRAHTQKATASNAGPAITGVRLAARTGDKQYLDFAKKVYAYWRGNMVDPTSFEVYDHNDPTGKITKYRFTYNEGLMIGAAVELWRATKDPAFLVDAEHIAGHMLAAETVSTSYGKVLFDGTNGQCGGDCQQFKGIGYRYLKSLYDNDYSHIEYGATLRASAESIWALARAPGNAFATDWAGPATASASIDAQSSAAMALELFAESVGPYPATMAGRFEAEDGLVRGIGLEATHGAYSGWAYLAGWNGDGQSVGVGVHAGSAGAHAVTLRYAAGAGDAARAISVDGTVALAKQTFAATGSWDAWASSTVMLTLPSGRSTITVAYDAARGSANYLNLDFIDVAP